MERKQITFDTFIRGVLAAAIVVGIVMLLNRLSSVLVPFFLAWLVAYLLFPLVRFFQYRCRMKYRILAILSAFLVTGAVLAGVFWLMIPPMIEEGGRVASLIINYVQTDETMSNIPRLLQQYIHDNIDIEHVKKLVTQDGFIDTVKETIPRVWAVIAQSLRSSRVSLRSRWCCSIHSSFSLTTRNLLADGRSCCRSAIVRLHSAWWPMSKKV